MIRLVKIDFGEGSVAPLSEIVFEEMHKAIDDPKIHILRWGDKLEVFRGVGPQGNLIWEEVI